MADVSRLVGLLQDYHTVLTDQRRRVGEAHRALAERYGALDRVYEGEGAAEFKSAWRQADEAFEAYTEGVPAVLSLLSDKIEHLRRLDRGL